MNATGRLSLAALLVTFSLGALQAQQAPSAFVPFDDFVWNTQTARVEDYPESLARDASAFEEMRQHILTMYQGVQVTQLHAGFQPL